MTSALVVVVEVVEVVVWTAGDIASNILNGRGDWSGVMKSFTSCPLARRAVSKDPFFDQPTSHKSGATV